ncbi:hypothetical protein LshimejAT787_0503240 [Lyophyllum shimeji]|uniref:Uncharacterized protein n=1 Tax=Lyophyllum shimeji TaxID=47721 RepID=A0A9P3PN30_LYOSH|nr:hypothetical protein LshimejAT787_0503240 [Lyophyllum shimeji]
MQYHRDYSSTRFMRGYDEPRSPFPRMLHVLVPLVIHTLENVTIRSVLCVLQEHHRKRETWDGITTIR